MKVSWGMPPNSNVVELRPGCRTAAASPPKLTGRAATGLALSNFSGASANKPTKKPMLALPAPAPPERGPLLASDENPGGWIAADLIYQLHRELEDRRRAATFSTAEHALACGELHRGIIDHLREAEILELQLAELMNPTLGQTRYGPGDGT